MTTCGPAGDEAELDELAFVLDLLLEQPAKPATTMTRPATPTMIPRFTNALLYVAGVALRRVVARSKLSGPLTRRDRGPTFMTPFGGGYPVPGVANGGSRVAPCVDRRRLVIARYPRLRPALPIRRSEPPVSCALETCCPPTDYTGPTRLTAQFAR